ncbi:methyltransferase domain-containing protein [Candidatus Roizmanbacteria bacterium]|nr:methyltransferase domain-containing protein [Candidatus Roizmanbacteria bacterium]
MQKKIDHNLKEYYSKRAEEYDAVYQRNILVRIKEQEFIGKEIHKLFKGKHVLELACGTGYWTKYLVGSAEKVLASDISVEMLKIASQRITDSSFQFLIGDAYNPPISVPLFTGAMANFWFSHIPKIQITQFLSTLHKSVALNSSIMFVDGVYRKELGGRLIKKKGGKDTWKRRILESKEEFDILKNYYTKEELTHIFAPYSNNVTIDYLTHFWVVKYTMSIDTFVA